MKLFITGGAGFIGANFILYWMREHPVDEIINYDVLSYAGNLENLHEVEHKSNYTFIHGDICDSDKVMQVTKEVDVIVHFAAESHVDRSITDPFQFVKTNVLGTQTLLNAALKNNINRFHHISTDEVFGALSLDTVEKFSEETPYDPRSPYSASKASSDHLVRSYYHTYGLPITITNCSNNYGPYQFPEKLISLAITNILEGKKVPVYGDGKYVRDWLYVEDHCRAIEAVLLQGKVGETYCVGGMTEGIDNLTLIKKILRIMNRDDSIITFVKDRPGHDRRYTIDWTKISKSLGWKPKYDIDTYLAQTVTWYTSNISWWQKIKNGKYQSYYNNQYGATEGVLT